jgi:N-acetylglucosaminyl-diphospho-decaprenol L-rhamnosyltransferase
MPNLAVTIVNWNVRDLLAACLRSVRVALDAAGLSGKVWVVDNASHDGSVDLLREQFPDVCLVASPTNLGFAGGQNLAMRMLGFSSVPVPADCGPQLANSKSSRQERGISAAPHMPIGGSTAGESRCAARRPLPDYVLILNPDTLVRESAIGEMVSFMERHPPVGVCGPRLVYADGSFQHAAYRFPSLAQTFLDFWPINWRLARSRLNGRYARPLYEGREPFSIDHPLGAAMLFRRAAIEQTGGFDLDYHMYVEEIDWCMRVKRAGWEICCVPRAEIVHYEGQSTRQVRPQMVVALWRSRCILFGKHYSPLYQWVVRRLIRAGMRAKIKQTRAAVSRGEMDEETAQALIDAYRQVIDM